MLAGLPLLLPFSILVCDWRWELGATAACFSVFVMPGTLLVPIVFTRTHPFGGLLGRFGLATVASLLLFGLPAVVATKLHWRLPSFLIAYVILYGLVCVACAVALLQARRRPAAAPLDWPPLQLPTLYSRWTGLAMLAGAALTLAGASLGFQARDRQWWSWTGIGLAGGAIALLVVSLDSLRLRKALSDRPPALRGAPPEREPATIAPHETWIATVLWLCVAAVVAYLMLVSYEVPRWFYDDVTHGSRAVDLLTGEPMDRYEPSLGQDIPQVPGYILATVSLLVATFSWVTRVPCADLAHSVLQPILVLAGASSMAAALAVVLRRDRLLVPLALLVMLLVLLKSSDVHRSLVHFLVLKVTQPKCVHLMVMYPVQLASLLLLVTHPSRRHTLVAAAVALAGYLVHPWACVVGSMWAGTLVAYCLIARRGAFFHALTLFAFASALGAAHQFEAKYNIFGVGDSPAQTPVEPVELAREGTTHLPRLDARLTIGTYSLYRLGILSIPWLVLLGWRSRKSLLIGLLSFVAVGVAFVEPAGALLSKAMTITLLWRMRWLLPSALGAALLAVCIYWAVTIILRRSDGRVGPARLLVGVAVTLAAVVGMIWSNSSSFLQRGGHVERLSKFQAVSHQVADALGGFSGEAYVLAPDQRRCRVSMELCQLMPRVRLVIPRRQVIEWYFGEKELARRLRILLRFYVGAMTPAQFERMRQEFPVDCVIVDHGLGRGRYQVRLLSALGWQRGRRFGAFEIWRAPRQDRGGA